MPTRHWIPLDDQGGTAESQEIVAVHHTSPGDRWLIFSHGLVSDKSGSYQERCERAVEKGYNAVRFDHRGCGESDGSFGTQNFETRLADLRAVIDWFDPGECVLFGSSFGGRVVLFVATTTSVVSAVVTRAPVTYTEYLNGIGASSESFRSALEDNPFADVIENISVPVAIFHGREDETVAPAGSIEAAEALDDDTLCFLQAGEGHRFSAEAESRLRTQMFAWLESYQ